MQQAQAQLPHVSHSDPWGHGWICCDAEHAASTSLPHSSTVPLPRQGSISTSGGSCENCPHSHLTSCPMEAFCCQDEDCPDIQGDQAVECCTDPACVDVDVSGQVKMSADVDVSGHGGMTDMAELEKWAASKEGSEAIQQYLECCTQTNCSLPCHQPANVDLNCAHSGLPGHHQHLLQQPQQYAVHSTPPLPPSTWSTPTTVSTIASPAVLLPNHICHWKNCHQTFHSMPDLLNHVAADHLGAAAFPAAVVQVTQPVPPPPTEQFNNLVQSQQEADHLLSCLWDDCFPLPPDCSAEIPEACPSHPLNHTDHANHSHTLGTGEPFSPQTMLRHVLEEHLGVPGEILGWGEEMPDLSIPSNAQANITKGHARMHHHHHPLPTPSPSAATLSSPSDSPPPIKMTTLICQWPGCTHSEPFPNAASLMEHLADVHVGKGKDSYTCLFGSCGPHGRVFRSRQKVLRHLQSHTGHRPFICEVCSQGFSEAAPLAAHMRRHAREKPFKCDHPGCGKEFAISSSLTIHMRTHNGDKPFICPHCHKGFIEASNLTKHIRTHTGERPFACHHPGCGRCFARPDQLKRHMGVHESGKMKRKSSSARA
ncbi:hypothetical protein BCR39DRAFT_530976 [Naematelia encephala]|uniref:C2H2-type domain-containing protein n=1 Tax=Naematelia encephala TaxID=71784 RepID=A0A1Y2B4Z2_9TREE|nr:hypothetical protein BCR39DRAFT_530976 [Naematelia encephala]